MRLDGPWVIAENGADRSLFAFVQHGDQFSNPEVKDGEWIPMKVYDDDDNRYSSEDVHYQLLNRRLKFLCSHEILMACEEKTGLENHFI
jgi:ligand-binding sensor domain-containing protein